MEIKIVRDNEIHRDNEESQIKKLKKNRRTPKYSLCKRDFPITSIIPTLVITCHVGSNLRLECSTCLLGVGPAEAQ